MTSSRAKRWQRVRDVEDLLALVARAESRRKLIRVHAWQRSGNWDVIFDESTAMKEELAELREQLGSVWAELHAETRKKAKK